MLDAERKGQTRCLLSKSGSSHPAPQSAGGWGKKNIDLKNFRFQDLEDVELSTHEMANLRGTESSPFITGRSIEL